MIKFCTGLLVLMLLGGCSGISRKQQQLINNTAPLTRYILFDKSYHSLSEHLGKIVVLSFWDAYCSHCKKSLPLVGRIAESFHGDPRIVFLGVSINEQDSESDVKYAVDYLALQSIIPAFSGNGALDEAFLAYHGESVPLFVLIDKKGTVKWIGDDVYALKSWLIQEVGNLVSIFPPVSETFASLVHRKTRENSDCCLFALDY